MALVLMHQASGKRVEVGGVAFSFRGEQVTVESFNERRVYCRNEAGQSHEWFHSVIGCYVFDDSRDAELFGKSE